MKKKVVEDVLKKSKTILANEPVAAYYPSFTKQNNLLHAQVASKVIAKDFSFTEFKKIADKSPFTLSEWAGILHISERTLQRYAVYNSCFGAVQIELILLMKKLIDIGQDLFGVEGLREWLDSSVFSLQHKKPMEYLTSYAGIQTIIQLMGRIQHGIPA
jgi:putative toxin-antitoxin system antitoxin component (TIGR02293 family)